MKTLIRIKINSDSYILILDVFFWLPIFCMETFGILYVKICTCIYTHEVIYRRLLLPRSAAVETVTWLIHEFEVNQTKSIAGRSVRCYEQQ